MASWDLLEEREEQDLHKTRLLNVEEKPFRRITKRIASISALAREMARQQPTPPPAGPNGDGSESQGNNNNPGPALKRERAQLKEDLTHDFAAFDNSIARLQFLLDANERERQRYAADQQRILDECQAIRLNNGSLRERLEEARATLAQRKVFDKMADDITNKNLLRPRDDQRIALQKLEEECADLERESETYSVTWRERKEQFARIMDEAMRLRRQIRDEKEEVERREGMNEDGEEDGEVSRGVGTPRPDGEVGTPRPAGGGTSGGRTPAREAQGDDTQEDGLKPRYESLGGLSGRGSAAPSRDGTPRPQQADDEVEEGEDVEMDDPGSKAAATGQGGVSGAATPQITIEAPQQNDDKMEVDN